MARLHILSPREIAKAIDLTASFITFGRAPDNAICIDEPNVSKYHGILVRDGDGYQLHDFNSTNGTFVNGDRILALKLPQEASIRLGPVELRYESTLPKPAVAPLGVRQLEAGLKPAAKQESGMSKRVNPDFARGQLEAGPVVLQPGFSRKPIPRTSDTN